MSLVYSEVFAGFLISQQSPVRVEAAGLLTMLLYTTHIAPILVVLQACMINANPVTTNTSTAATLPAQSASISSTNETTNLTSLPTRLSAEHESGNNRVAVNCKGSKIPCLGISAWHIIPILRGYMAHLTVNATYYAGQDIACIPRDWLPFARLVWSEGAYCAFLQGKNVPTGGVDGVTLLQKMDTLIQNGCLGCGSSAVSDTGGMSAMGSLTVNYVRHSSCEGLCVYESMRDSKPVLEWKPDAGIVAVDRS